MTGKQQQMKIGHILGLCESGCKFVKEDAKYLYFKIPKDFEQDSLSAINQTLYEYTGLKLKVARVL